MNVIYVQKFIQGVLHEMEYQRYSPETINSYHKVYNSLIKYIRNHKLSEINEEACLEFLHFRTGHNLTGFYGKGTPKINMIMKPLEVLLRYQKTGIVKFKKRPDTERYICPFQFVEEYQAFQDEFEERRYAQGTVTSLNSKLHKFLLFLAEEGVVSSTNISVVHLTKFISSYQGRKPKYIATVTGIIRNYLTFLYTENFLLNDISHGLPHVRIMRNAFIPYSWKTDDVKKLLGAIDRNDPMGKRDYAMLLLVARLGLRVSDMRGLKLSCMDWGQKTISIVMQKTKQPLELPILEDIGWAIIDYLKNGRPETKCDRVFVRHRAPYDSFGENDCFQHSLHRYMLKAGLRIPLDVHCGLHSLRSTLARNMLESKAPLPVISAVLGHQSIHTTSIYLKIDLDGLRKCALDPEEVFQS